MNIGPILFMQPWALIGLLALPILWLLLRATPPEPKRLALPSLALLDDLRPDEETPARTPWWLLLLRLIALALAIFGFARPTWAPNQIVGGEGGTLVVVDDGWTSAERWRDIVRTATAAVDESADAGAPIHILFTAPREVARDPSETLDFETARQELRNARPSPWSPDRAAALARLEETGLAPGRIVWATDGFDHDSAAAFARGLAALAPTEVRVTRPKNAFAITSADSSAEGARVAVVRSVAVSGAAATADLIAETAEGASIASARLAFEPAARTAEALFAIPAAALNRVARFRIAGSPSAGAVWLWDDSARRPSVGLADTRDEAQPLLAEHYYVRKALQPYAQLTEKPLSDLLTNAIDAIVLGDRGTIDEAEADQLSAWVDDGGVLVRFAGPRLAAQSDPLTPTALRPTSRALGGALAWETPQRIADFTSDSPFFGIPRPTDAVVRQQVLAQPSAELAGMTWARLQDGTPLVTATRRGKGELILFHVTADPDWSDLPFTGAFVEMLRRSVVSGGERSRPQLGTEGALAPVRVLDGFGVLGQPPSAATPIEAMDFETARPGPTTPPGLYSGPGGERALNAGAPAPADFTSWPPGMPVTDQAAVLERRGLGGWMIGGALAIVAIDLLIALAFAGRLNRFGSAAGAIALILAAAQAAPSAEAQTPDVLAREAAAHLRLAFVKTGDSRLDEITRAGLFGLSYELGARTSVEPDQPHGIDLSRDALEFYPMIYYAVPREAKPISPAGVAKINAYLRNGGAFVVDTRDAAPGRDVSTNLSTLLAGIDAPPLQPAPATHVLTKSYYLIKSFPGRMNGRLWIEGSSVDRDTRRGDGVSGLFIGGSDWAGAWAIDQNGKPLLSMEGGQPAREMSYRFGINLVMYILTGNYKEDQVHIPDLLERLGRDKVRAPGSSD
ncbi:MAG: DUF4159 domain-containing protein [Alphaproteobacteria bacterium]|nr:DUF4159 domain-containing protein [Alphaproteobacteria bacterium]